MALRKFYVGSLGPFEYDDTDAIDDADGDFSGESYNAIVTSGQLRIGEVPSDSMHAVRKSELDALAGTYEEGSFTLTAMGMSAVVQATAYYVKRSKLVSMYIPLLSGTSNDTGFTLTGLPAALTPVRDSWHYASIVDNGNSDAGHIVLTTASTTLVVWRNNNPINTWTGSGTKTVRPVYVNYLL
jgi:hypothetical protein